MMYILRILILIFALALFAFHLKYLTIENENLIIFKSISASERASFVQPFGRVRPVYYVTPKYNLAGCIIPKSMSQLVTATMCYLYEPEAFLAGNQSMYDVHFLRDKRFEFLNSIPIFAYFLFCLDVTETTRSKYSMRPKKKDINIRRYAIIRDPFDRFLSFYLNKCIAENHCWDCNGDMRCVARRAYENLRAFRKAKPMKRVTRHKYEEFHAAPLSWYCDFNSDLSAYDIFVMGPKKEERVPALKKFGDLLYRQNVPHDQIKYIMDHALGGESTHSTFDDPKRKETELQLKTDPVVRKYLHRIYYYDYHIFELNRNVLDEEYR
ncbi:unnamed protein product [Caenorhabditis bovis]|uniref:Sulfotransferase domain-containing protein n=1 Tax=Caenorhabditis bovis TaxID=2654633 RepID=A0A8S1EYB4_9PELO|nr:unnamed protein product [Caenorhabditis bovis]